MFLDLAPAAVHDAKAAFVTGLHAAAVVASVLHAALGTVALRWLPRAVPSSDTLLKPTTDRAGSKAR